MIDFITGVGKQYRIDPIAITSRRAWLGVMKKSATIVSIFSVALILKGINLLSEEYISVMLSILIMAEGYSSIQNIYAIRTGSILPEFDAISIFLKTFSEFLKEKIDKSIPKSPNIPKK